MNLMIIAAMAALNLTAATPASANPAPTTGDRLPAIYAQGDVADSVWRAGRRAIADEEWDRAADAFKRLRTRYAKSAYFGDSYYWQAFSLYQKGGRTSWREAVTLLETQRDDYSSAATAKSGESRQLLTRIRGVLARNGDEPSAAAIAQIAGDAVTIGLAAATAVRGVAASVAAGVAAASAEAGGAGAAAAGRAAASAARAGRNGGRSSAVPGCPSEDDDDRVAALNALLQMNGNDALPLLKKVLERRDKCSETLRRKAVFLVSQKRGTEAADILMETAKNDPDSETREQAVFWLGQVDSERSTALLEQILKTSTDENLQDKALFALSQGRESRGSTVLRDYAAREDAPMHLREQAIFWLGQRRGDENAQYLRTLFDKTKNNGLREKIIFSVSQTRSPANQQFLLDQAVNKSNSMDVRKQALFWAGQSGAADVAKIASLYDKGGDLEFREQVIFVLSQRPHDPAAVDKLIEIAKTEKDRDLRQKAIFWLGQSRDPKALKALGDLILKNPE